MPGCDRSCQTGPRDSKNEAGSLVGGGPLRGEGVRGRGALQTAGCNGGGSQRPKAHGTAYVMAFHLKLTQLRVSLSVSRLGGHHVVQPCKDLLKSDHGHPPFRTGSNKNIRLLSVMIIHSTGPALLMYLVRLVQDGDGGWLGSGFFKRYITRGCEQERGFCTPGLGLTQKGGCGKREREGGGGVGRGLTGSWLRAGPVGPRTLPLTRAPRGGARQGTQ